MFKVCRRRRSERERDSPLTLEDAKRRNRHLADGSRSKMRMRFNGDRFRGTCPTPPKQEKRRRQPTHVSPARAGGNEDVQCHAPKFLSN